MKLFFALLLCALPATVLGQSTMKTFTAPNGVFQFHYPATLVRCTNQSHDQNYRGNWTPFESCEAYIPVCDDPSVTGSQTITCFALPRAEIQSPPTFNAATFAVARINSAKTEKACLVIAGNWDTYLPKNPNTVRINGTQFHFSETSEAGMNHHLEGHIYLAFHRDTCYQLSIRIATTSGSVFDKPVPNFSVQSEAKVLRQLNRALDSFRFLH